jgi:hypothetical protein
MAAMIAVGELIGRVDTRYLLGTGLGLTAAGRRYQASRRGRSPPDPHF